jgi:hypothetical protein
MVNRQNLHSAEFQIDFSVLNRSSHKQRSKRNNQQSTIGWQN